MDINRLKHTNMVNYQNGKIYKLWSDQSDCFYIGSTTRSLCKRLNDHTSGIKTGKRTTQIEMRNHTNIRIELIENYPCSCRDELLAREGHHIRLNRENLLNQIVPGRTPQEYYEDNKAELSKQRKEKYEENKENVLKQRKNYREAKTKKKYQSARRIIVKQIKKR